MSSCPVYCAHGVFEQLLMRHAQNLLLKLLLLLFTDCDANIAILVCVCAGLGKRDYSDLKNTRRRKPAS